MRIALEPATPVDAPAVVALRNAAAHDLTARFGIGHWSSASTEKSVLYDMRHSMVCAARHDDRLIATLVLTRKKPWAIDRKYFTRCDRPLYLISMAVDPDLQRRGVGRGCLEEAGRIVRAWPADAIRLDAYDAASGAGEFYRKCGFREVGRASFKDVALIYFEWLTTPEVRT